MIHINEIMIGNWLEKWVDCKPYPVRVVGILDDGNILVKDKGEESELPYYINAQKLSGITIGKEFLKKNGFTQDSKDGLYWSREVEVLTPERCSVEISLQNEDPEYDDFSARVDVYAGCGGDFRGRETDANHIHELQNILRVCDVDLELVV